MRHSVPMAVGRKPLARNRENARGCGEGENAMRPGRRAMAAKFGRGRASVLLQFVRAVVLLGALVFSFAVSAETAGDSRAYRLGPGDRITVIVFGQPELSGDILVDGAGNIPLPFIGPIQVKGL